MKTLKFLITITLTAFIGIAFFSCKDDDENFNPDTLLGEWKCTHSEGYYIIDGKKESWNKNTPPANQSENDYNSVGTIIVFNKDKTYDYTLPPNNTKWSGEWYLKENKLYFVDEGYNEETDEEYDEEYNIPVLNSDTLVIEFKEKSTDSDGSKYEEYSKNTFKRVNSQ